MKCDKCPIIGTKYCHRVNPDARKLTPIDKRHIAAMVARGEDVPESVWKKPNENDEKSKMKRSCTK